MVCSLHRRAMRTPRCGANRTYRNPMLYEFVSTYRDAIIAKTRVKVSTRPWPPASSAELEHGLPLFLTQLAETLRWEHTDTPFSNDAIGDTAAHHGRELLALGFTVAQIVHDYGDICQAI